VIAQPIKKTTAGITGFLIPAALYQIKYPANLVFAKQYCLE